MEYLSTLPPAPSCSKCFIDRKTYISGIGLETARDLASRGARLILACRNMDKGKEAAEDIIRTTGNTNLIVKKLDLACMKTVRLFAKDILASERRCQSNFHNSFLLINDFLRDMTLFGCNAF